MTRGHGDPAYLRRWLAEVAIMPILDVEVVGSIPDAVAEGLAERIADAAAEAVGSRPQGTWVKLRCLGEDAYAENGGGPPEGVEPVLVSVLQAEVAEGGELEEQALRLTRGIAEACDRPVENVHIIFEPPAAGRVSFGGKLRR